MMRLIAWLTVIACATAAIGLVAATGLHLALARADFNICIDQSMVWLPPGVSPPARVAELDWTSRIELVGSHQIALYGMWAGGPFLSWLIGAALLTLSRRPALAIPWALGLTTACALSAWLVLNTPLTEFHDCDRKGDDVGMYIILIWLAAAPVSATALIGALLLTLTKPDKPAQGSNRDRQ